MEKLKEYSGVVMAVVVVFAALAGFGTWVIDARVKPELIRLEGRIEQIDFKIDANAAVMNTRFDLVDERFKGVNQRFKSIDQRFDSIDRRFDSVDQRFKRMEADIKTIRDDIRALPLRLATGLKAGLPKPEIATELKPG